MPDPLQNLSSGTLPPPNVESSGKYIVQMENITKGFPGVIANQNVHLHVVQGTFHAVIGENGAGKSTLLNILYGRYRPDAGRIWIAGEEVTNALHAPADAIRRGIGLVSQHYALIPALTVIENVMLGAERSSPGGILQPGKAGARIQELARQLGLDNLDLHARTERLSVAAQQKIEILKALYRGARILLLDEPTATLAPQEVESLFALLHTLAAQGSTILFVTHKLREVMTHSQYVSVLRAGQSAGDFVTSQTNEQDLLRVMIGARSNLPTLLNPDEADRSGGTGEWRSGGEIPFQKQVSSPLLQIENVTVRNARGAEAVQSASLDVGRGEIVGVAGVDGSGQRELSEAVVGLRRMETGRLFLEGVEITRLNTRQRQKSGIAYIPEDRHRAGMILDFSIAENYLLGHEREAAWGGGLTLDTATLLSRAQAMVQRYDVRGGTAGGTAPGGTLSGGNQQKLVFARAMDSGPRLLVACQPTRGLDVEASRFVYKTIQDARAQGMGVLLFSLDLDEVLQLSDRIAVMFNGRVAGILRRQEATPERVGALMTGAVHE
jgi:ABC-type uncharacterized transport system ATPase subunit